MATAVNYYPHHIGDYLRDTAHLTPLEDGIYRRLLDVYYASEKPLPPETQWVCKLVRARTTDEIDAVVEILRQFFEKSIDGWRNKRADEEIKAHYRRIKAAKTNGKRGGRPKNPVGLQKEPSGLAKTALLHNLTESSQNQIQNQNQKELTPIAPSAKAHDAAAGINGNAVCYIPINDGTEFGVSLELAEELAKLYPLVDVPQTLNEIRGWNMAHPQRRKTRRGVIAHINGWMSKEQNRGPTR